MNTIGERLEVSVCKQPLKFVVEHAAWVAPVILKHPHPLELGPNLRQFTWICDSSCVRCVPKERAPSVHSLNAGQEQISECDGHFNVRLLIWDQEILGRVLMLVPPTSVSRSESDVAL
ncbi:MAG: hypothetical protein ACOYD0_11300 [Candidatus Nanopelagicales bacterium]